MSQNKPHDTGKKVSLKSRLTTNKNSNAYSSHIGHTGNVKNLHRRFGDHCFDFIKECKHNLPAQSDTNLQRHQGDCPLCKLANLMTRGFFAKEEALKNEARQRSFINRAILRSTLLLQWSQCQPYNAKAQDLDSCLEMMWSSGLVEILCNSSTEDIINDWQRKFEQNIRRKQAFANQTLASQESPSYVVDFNEMIKIIKRRNRIYEVGHFAAIYLQSRIRRFLASLKVRRLLITRFELVPPTRRLASFYYDSVKARKWTVPPKLIRNEPPGTPRTIVRRLQFEDSIKEKRFSKFLVTGHEENGSRTNPQEALERILKESFVEKEERALRLYKQVLILRDLLTVYMNQLQGPVWVSLSPPGPPSRTLGIALALQFTVSPVAQAKAAAKKLNSSPQRNSSLKRSASKKQINEAFAKAEVTASSPKKPGQSKSTSNAIIYRALQVLEQSARDSLVANDADEVINKIVFSDILSVYEGVLNIAKDENQIWDESYRPPLTCKSRPLNASSKEEDVTYGLASISMDSVESREYEEMSDPLDKQVMPFALQLRPAYPDRHPNGYFRLFFYQEEFIALTAASPWVFYPEIIRHRDNILTAISKFATSRRFRQMIHEYMMSANRPPAAQKIGRSSESTVSSISSSSTRKPAAPKGPLPSATRRIKEEQDANSYFVPPEEKILPLINDVLVRKPLEAAVLNDQQALALSEQYKFLKGNTSFQDRLKRAMNSAKSRARKTPGTKESNNASSKPGFVEVESALAKSENVLNIKRTFQRAQEGNCLKGIEIHEMLDQYAVFKSREVKSVMDKIEEDKDSDVYSNGAMAGKERASKDNAVGGEALDPYTKALFEHSIVVDSRIFPRIMQIKDIGRLPRAQLMAIDVHVQLPKPNPTGPAAVAKQVPAGAGKRRVNTGDSNSYDDAGNLSPRTEVSNEIGAGSVISDSTTRTSATTATAGNLLMLAPPTELPVSLHQIVGSFCCESDRVPSNLDCGLLDFSYFHRIYRERVKNDPSHADGPYRAVPAGPPLTGGGLASVGKDKGWMPPDPSTGVTVGRALLPTGREFQYHILGNNPSIDHLENTLPRRIKVWLGLQE